MSNVRLDPAASSIRERKDHMLKQKITIVLLPGLNGTSGLFKPLLECKPDNFDVVCIAYPTHDIKNYFELTELVMSELRKIQGSFILVGESFSGPIALFISHKKPDGLLGTIMVASFVSAPNLKIARYLPWRIGFRLAKPLYAHRIALSKEKNQSFLKIASLELKKVSPEVLAHRIQQVFSVNAEAELQECDVSLAYFRGKYDYIVPKWNFDTILRLKPKINVVTFSSQHFLLQSRPQEAWTAISAFANGVALENVLLTKLGSEQKSDFKH